MQIIPLPAFRYGSGIYILPGYLGIMINGRMFQIKNGGRFQFKTWDNWWRKKRRPIERT